MTPYQKVDSWMRGTRVDQPNPTDKQREKYNKEKIEKPSPKAADFNGTPWEGWFKDNPEK